MNNNSISMTKMLFVYGKLNPGISYVQGMNEIIAVLFYVIKKGQPDLEQCMFSFLFLFFCFCFYYRCCCYVCFYRNIIS